MVGPRFSVNALAETKFIFFRKVTIAYWQTLKKHPTRLQESDALLTDAILRGAARSTGQKKSGPALPTKVSRNVRYWQKQTCTNVSNRLSPGASIIRLIANAPPNEQVAVIEVNFDPT